ncbi:hypothetical protein Tco_0579038 [Tanacetum coccineum]
MGKYKALKAELALLTKKIDVVSKNKLEKGLVVKSFDCDKESLSSEDEGVTRVKAFMAIAEDELAVGKTDARYGQWVKITMKQTSSKVTLDQLLTEQVLRNIIRALGGREPLPSLPKLSGAEPIGTSNDVIPPADSIQTSTVSDKTKHVTEKESSVKAIKKKAQTKSSTISDPSPSMKADSSTEQLLLTLMKEVK